MQYMCGDSQLAKRPLQIRTAPGLPSFENIPRQNLTVPTEARDDGPSQGNIGFIGLDASKTGEGPKSAR
jgi:hypothetical protein